ncbi:MAG TPA: hypothetical protein ENN41_10390 [Sediminispirochaeta sp.]|nr:hypothetical protein [Sediminispirochaeta sp.]
MGCGCEEDAGHYTIFNVIWDHLTGHVHMVDWEKRASRYAICEECEHFFPVTKQCLKCGCFLKLKVKYVDSSCPVGKW